MTQPPEEGTTQAPSASAAAGAAPATTTPATAAFVGHAGYLPCPSGRVIFCVSHPAVGAAASADSSTAGHQQSARGTIVLVQTCTEERKASHRAMVGLAGRLAAAGYTTHRLDLPGCGESTGRLAALRLADWIADLTAVATRLLAVVPAEQRRYFGGLRLSAALAGCC
ncbi:MAG: hypothetical protein ACREJ2_04860, partial [Planctomycetota bacterium]